MSTFYLLSSVLGSRFGLQIVGSWLAEPLLRVAHTYEQCAGWFRQHPPLD